MHSFQHSESIQPAMNISSICGCVADRKKTLWYNHFLGTTQPLLSPISLRIREDLKGATSIINL